MWDTDNNNNENRTPIADPGVIIDAIVHCIDCASGREAIHDPDRYHKLKQDLKKFREISPMPLSKAGRKECEFTEKELKRMNDMRKKLRAVEWDDKRREETRYRQDRVEIGHAHDSSLAERCG